MKDSGITVHGDRFARVAIFNYQERVEGKNVTIRIEAPWYYSTTFGYTCQSQLEIDISSLQIIVNGQTAHISSYDLWTQEKLLMPARLIIDFIYYSSDSGVLIEKTQYNDYSWDPPVRETFGP